jgi:hypothetical protein
MYFNGNHQIQLYVSKGQVAMANTSSWPAQSPAIKITVTYAMLPLLPF